MEVVGLVALLPEPADRRPAGEGVFEESIAALRELNALGYGRPGSGLLLNLVTNPVRRVPAARPAAAERDWKRKLERRYGVVFDRLYTITNMPISRFLEFLEERGRPRPTWTDWFRAFNPAAASGRHVPQHDLGRLGRYALRLRLQSDARAAGRRASRGISAISTPTRSSARRDRAGTALLRMHGGGGVELRRGDWV